MQTQEQAPQDKEYNEAFEAAKKEMTASSAEAHKEPEKTATETAPEKTGTTDTEGDTPPQKEKSPVHGSVESIERALNETKAWGTKLAQENKVLAERLAALEAATPATKAQAQAAVVDAQKSQDDAKKKMDEQIAKVAGEFPELKELLQGMAQMTASAVSESTKVKADLSKITEETTKAQAEQQKRQHFESEVKPEILKVHPDFDTLFSTPETMKSYMDWAKTLSPAKEFAALQSSDPGDISDSITAFKKFKGSGQMETLKENDRKKQEAIRSSASLPRGGSNSVRGHESNPTGEPDPNDYDSSFEEAKKLLKKERKNSEPFRAG